MMLSVAYCNADGLAYDSSGMMAQCAFADRPSKLLLHDAKPIIQPSSRDFMYLGAAAVWTSSLVRPPCLQMAAYAASAAPVTWASEARLSRGAWVQSRNLEVQAVWIVLPGRIPRRQSSELQVDHHAWCAEIQSSLDNI